MFIETDHFICIVVVGVLTGLRPANANGIKEDIAIVRICNATHPVNLEVFNTYMMHHNFENLGNQSNELSCFLLCIYNEYKWMDRDGNLRLHRIKSWMRRANLSFNSREILVRKCLTTDLSDPCTRARHFTECFWANHQGTGTFSDNNHTLHAIIRKKNAT